jgi:hypothetical protein
MRSIRLLLSTLVVSIAIAGAAAYGSPGEDQAAELLVAARAALGGPRLDAVTTLKATGEYRRMLGEREIDGDVTIELAAPDRMKRTEQMGFPGGPTMTRIVALNGTEYWDDVTNQGGGRFMQRMGADGGRQGRSITEADRERFRQMQQRRLTNDLHRLMVVWLMRTDAPVTYVGTAEASDGKADVLDVAIDAQGPPLRLYLDAQTHVPLMVSYKGVLPRFNMRRTGGPESRSRSEGAGATGSNAPTPPAPDAPPQAGPGPDASSQAGATPPDPARPREPPQQVTFELRLSDYKKVDGVLLPHLMTQSVDGKVTEELTIDSYKINPKFDQDTFVKKSR